MENRKKIILALVVAASVVVLILGLGLGLGLGLDSEAEAKKEEKYKTLFTQSDIQNPIYPVVFYWETPEVDDSETSEYLEFGKKLEDAKFLINKIYEYPLMAVEPKQAFYNFNDSEENIQADIKKFGVKKGILIGKAIDIYYAVDNDHYKALRNHFYESVPDFEFKPWDSSLTKDDIYDYIKNWVNENN